MKTNNDDFSNASYPKEHNISGTFKFTDLEGNYYTLDLDFSPQSFLNVIGKNSIRKPTPWAKFQRFTEEELAQERKVKPNSKRQGIYKPAPNVNSIIASLIEEKVSA